MYGNGKCPVCGEEFEKACNRQIFCGQKCKLKNRYAREKRVRTNKSLPKRFRFKAKSKRKNQKKKAKKKPKNPQIEIIPIPRLRFLFKKVLNVDVLLETPCFMCEAQNDCEPQYCQKLTEWLNHGS